MPFLEIGVEKARGASYARRAMWKLRPLEVRELVVGDSLGPYWLEALLGEGGMGLVFKAVRAGDGAVVALKVLKMDLTHDDVYRQRFVHEARSAAEVQDPHLVPILDAGEADGRDYLAVGFVDGRTLDETIAEEGPLPIEKTLGVAADMGAGLDALHGAGIVHRDIKASNIMLGQDGTAMLTDFGLAKGRAYTVLTKPGQVMGTLDYLAPELIRGQKAAPASDIYAMGCTIYECVAGKTPFGDRSVFQVGMAHLEDVPSDPGTGRGDWSPALSRALLSALEKDPARRPETATAYANMLSVAAKEGSG